MTNVGKALLLAEWRGQFHGGNSTCPVCDASFRHKPSCAMDLALAERGFGTREERNKARAFIETGALGTAQTLPPPEDR
jgi:hypothetical protein